MRETVTRQGDFSRWEFCALASVFLLQRAKDKVGPMLLGVALKASNDQVVSFLEKTIRVDSRVQVSWQSQRSSLLSH